MKHVKPIEEFEDSILEAMSELQLWVMQDLEAQQLLVELYIRENCQYPDKVKWSIAENKNDSRIPFIKLSLYMLDSTYNRAGVFPSEYEAGVFREHLIKFLDVENRKYAKFLKVANMAMDTDDRRLKVVEKEITVEISKIFKLLEKKVDLAEFFHERRGKIATKNFGI